MNNSAFVLDIKKSSYPILIIDKVGKIGEELANILRQESLIILVSNNPIRIDNVIHIPFDKKIPSIPDNTYSHIIYIDDYFLSSHLIAPIVKKAKIDNAVLLICSNSQHVNKSFVKEEINSYEKTKLILTGDIFSEKFIYDENTVINSFIKQLKNNKSILVSDNHLQEIAPVYFDDVVMAILQIGFVEKNNNKIYFLYTKNKLSQLSLAHMFQRIYPDIKIDFVKRKEAIRDYLDKDINGIYFFDDNYSLTARIKKIDINIDAEVIKREEYYIDSARESNSKLTKIFIGTMITLFLFILLPFLTTIFLAGFGGYFLNNFKNNLLISNYSSARQDVLVAYNFLSASKATLGLLNKQAEIIGREDLFAKFSNNVNYGFEVSKSAYILLGSAEKIKQIINGESKNPNQDFTVIIDSVKDALVLYQKEKDTYKLPLNFQTFLDNSVSFIAPTIDYWGEILGFVNEKTYLILFENNMELRPGGGFIGSYGVLRIKMGQIIDFKIYDVYDADGQLKNRVEPPFAIRRYLPSTNWYLRDSNFSVDFSQNALAAASFINSSMNTKIDGVIAVDLYFLNNLLAAIGPVKVIDYNETVNADNLYEITQSYAQDNFFPGSTQKKNFLKSLYTAIVQKLNQDKNISYLGILNGIYTSIKEKHILFAFNNSNIQSVFSINGWGSTLFDNRDSGEAIVNDFVGISEANIGANKVNYFIKRNVSQTVSIENSGRLTQELVISFNNSASSSLGKDGVYRNYLRIILPNNSKLDKIFIDDKEQKIAKAITDPSVYEKKGFKAPDGLEVEEVSEGRKKIYGFLISVNPESVKTIKISYGLDKGFSLLKTDYLYNLKIFKQPGIEYFPYSLTVNYPSSFRPINLPNHIKQNGNPVIYVNDIRNDEEFKLRIVKQ